MPQVLVLSRTGYTHARTALRLRLPTFCLTTVCPVVPALACARRALRTHLRVGREWVLGTSLSTRYFPARLSVWSSTNVTSVISVPYLIPGLGGLPIPSCSM
jgi:hypothetical protein